LLKDFKKSLIVFYWKTESVKWRIVLKVMKINRKLNNSRVINLLFFYKFQLQLLNVLNDIPFNDEVYLNLQTHICVIMNTKHFLILTLNPLSFVFYFIHLIIVELIVSSTKNPNYEFEAKAI
jgi:hypothetical protein